MIFAGADCVSVGRSCSGQITGIWEPYIPNARATVQPFGRRSSPPPTERRSSNNPVPQTPSGRRAVVAAGMEATAVIRQPAECCVLRTLRTVRGRLGPKGDQRNLIPYARAVRLHLEPKTTLRRKPFSNTRTPALM